MDQLTSLRVFREVVEAGSFTAAANRLSMSAPMVSKHLSQLERQLGVRLLHRTSRHLNLTAAGRLYHEQCREALDLLDAAAENVGQASATPFGELKVSAPVWCATGRFAQVLAAYHRRYPEVTLDMHLDNRKVDLVAEGFDLALRATDDPSPALIARRLCLVEFVLVALPGFADGLVAADGADPPTLATVMPNYLALDRVRALTIPGALPFRLKPVMKSSDTTLTYHAVRAGTGAAFLPYWLVEQDLAAGRLVRVLGAEPFFQSQLFAVYTSRKQMLPKVRTFIDFMSEALGSPDAQPAHAAAA